MIEVPVVSPCEIGPMDSITCIRIDDEHRAMHHNGKPIPPWYLGEALGTLSEERAQRREVGEALVRVTEERDELTEATDRLRQHAIEHDERHQKIFDEWLRERARLVDERDDWKTLARLSATERDEARDEVVRLGREMEQWKARCHKAWDDGDKAAAERIRHVRELVRLRTIIGELGAGEAAEPEIDVSGSLRMSVAEQIGCPSCHTILNARAAGGCGDTWHWENRQQPEEQIEALRPEGEQPWPE